MIKILTIALVANILFANNKSCVIPDILLKTIKITENAQQYPFYIRSNYKLDIWDNIKYFEFKKTKDINLIDCINTQNCINIANTLIQKKYTNLDLGLFQINYRSYKYPVYSYFIKDLAYINACKVIEDKVKLHKGKWDWEVLASYYSMTPKLNQKYKKKLIQNYKKLLSEN